MRKGEVDEGLGWEPMWAAARRAEPENDRKADRAPIDAIDYEKKW